MAAKMKTETSKTPTAARGLWRATRGSEMAWVDMVTLGDFTYIEMPSEGQCGLYTRVVHWLGRPIGYGTAGTHVSNARRGAPGFMESSAGRLPQR